jgi:glycosyltransferase involved in cell wall biosynthesis
MKTSLDWPEPFGLVMIEAMACGTPVLAFRNGSVPEVIDRGITGEIVESVGEAICKMGGVLTLDRGRVRRRFEERFSAERMARDYVMIYEKVTGIGATPAYGRPLPKSGKDAGDAVH